MTNKRHFIRIAALLAVLGIGVIGGVWWLSSGSDNEVKLPQEVLKLRPGDGDLLVQKRERLGIELREGQYNINLYLDGENLADSPNTIKRASSYFYRPSESEELLTNRRYCLKAQYSLVSKPEDLKTVRWCFKTQ